MKVKIYSLVIILLFVLYAGRNFLTGFNHATYQKTVFSDISKIVSEADSFSFVKREGVTTDTHIAISYVTFSGMETIWKIEAQDEGILALEFTSIVNRGEFKVVLISPENEVVNILQQNEAGFKSVPLKIGFSRLKIVGLESSGELTLTISGGEKIKIEKFY